MQNPLIPDNYVWVHNRNWRVIDPSSTRLCRMLLGPKHKRCPAKAVAELNRGRSNAHKHSRTDSWWPYCSAHMFGQKIEGGLVLSQVHPDSVSAKQGFVS